MGITLITPNDSQIPGGTSRALQYVKQYSDHDIISVLCPPLFPELLDAFIFLSKVNGMLNLKCKT